MDGVWVSGDIHPDGLMLEEEGVDCQDAGIPLPVHTMYLMDRTGIRIIGHGLPLKQHSLMK